MAQRRILKRFLGHANEEFGESHSDPTTHGFDTRVGTPLLRPTSSQNANFDVSTAISCLDKSPGGDRAVLAGERLLKIIKIAGSNVTEEVDIRAAVAPPNTPESTVSTQNDKANITAVTWAHGNFDSTIITAGANGKIALYDVNRPISFGEKRRIVEHSRPVHRLAINPWVGYLLLSASQDGTARLFDIRIPMRREVFKTNAEGVRDVKWCTTRGLNFACSYSTGAVMQWDQRNSKAPSLRIIGAHKGSCSSISWHPDGVHLISGGLDQYCHVWDFSEKGGNRQKPRHTIQAPAPVSVVSWRPATWSSTFQTKRAAQVAVAYDDSNHTKNQCSKVQIWDMARPTLPFKEITEFESAPTALLWYERDLLWTVGREGHFVQNDLAFATSVIDGHSLSNFDLSSSGEALMLMEERLSTRRVKTILPTPSETMSQTRSSGGLSQSPNVGQLSISKSESEEDIGGSFLGPRPQMRKHGRKQASQSSASLSTTPPSADGVILKLDEAVKMTGLYKSQQIMALGHAPSAVKSDVYQYLSSRYLRRINRDARDLVFTSLAGLTGTDIVERVNSILTYFARTAEGVGHFRLAQTWRMLSFTIGLLLDRRADHHRQDRLRRFEAAKALREKQEKKDLKESQRLADQQQLLEDETPKPQRTKSPLAALHPLTKSILAEDIESTSNINTPLARPVRDTLIDDKITYTTLPPIDTDQLKLPPAYHSPSPKNIQAPQAKQVQTPDDEPTSSVDGYDFYDMDGFTTPAIDIAAPQRKQPFRLEYKFPDSGEASRPDMLRHDSGESFQMFSSSSDSHSKNFLSSSESAGNQSLPLTGHGSSIREAELSWENNRSFSNSTPNRSFETDNSLEVIDEYDLESPPPEPHFAPTFRLQKAFLDQPDAGNDTELEDVVPDQTSAPAIIPSDFLSSDTDPEFLPGPLNPNTLVSRLIQYEVQSGSLTPSILILLLKPLLSPSVIDEHQAAAILRQYHHRLESMSLFTEAALLRNLCQGNYLAVAVQGDVKMVGSMGYFCTQCGKRFDEGELAVGQRLKKCHRCRTVLDGCAVCEGEEEPIGSENFDAVDGDDDDDDEKALSSQSCIDAESPISRIWWWCQGCGHGGHAVCMQTWHEGNGEAWSDGCCPLEGCLHPCLPGKWREQWGSEKGERTQKALRGLVRDGTRGGTPGGVRLASGSGGVKRDSREVGESVAVETVRGALGSERERERERKKIVKVVAPGEE